jgi:hypothetical protein
VIRARAGAAKLDGMSYVYQPQQTWQPYPSRTTAPVSLHLVAVFQYLGGLLLLAFAAMLALAAAGFLPQLELAIGDSTWTNRPADITMVVAVVCAVFGVIGLIAIVLGRKVQRGRNWARILLTALNVLSIAGAAFQGYAEGYLRASTVAAIAVPALFVILLNTRAARSWCHHHTY